MKLGNDELKMLGEWYYKGENRALVCSEKTQSIFTRNPKTKRLDEVLCLDHQLDQLEDKMIKGAKREKMTVWDIARKYTKAFFEDMDRLNLFQPHIKCKATDHIQEQIDLVHCIEAKGYTYKTSDGT